MNTTAKAILLSIMGVGLATGSALADHIGIYSDAAGTSCLLELTTPGVPTNVYIFHKLTPGTIGSRFKVDDTSGVVHVGASSPYLSIGNPWAGVSIAYGSCLAGEVNAMTLIYYWFNEPISCGKLAIVPDPPVADILVTDCNFVEKVATGDIFYFNPDGNCDCRLPHPVDESSWGKVKALYR